MLPSSSLAGGFITHEKVETILRLFEIVVEPRLRVDTEGPDFMPGLGDAPDGLAPSVAVRVVAARPKGTSGLASAEPRPDRFRPDAPAAARDGR